MEFKIWLEVEFPKIFTPEEEKPKRQRRKYKPYGFKPEEEKSTVDPYQTLGIPNLNAELSPQEQKTFPKRLSRIRYYERISRKPWIMWILKGLESPLLSHRVPEDADYITRWDKLKKGEFWGVGIDRVLKVIDKDWGGLSERQLQKLVFALAKKWKTSIGSKSETLPHNFGMVTDDIYKQLTGQEPTEFGKDKSKVFSHEYERPKWMDILHKHGEMGEIPNRELTSDNPRPTASGDVLQPIYRRLG